MSTAATTTESTWVHPFEAAGLGKAPFRFVGVEEQDLCYGAAILNRDEFQRTGIAMTTKPGGTCAYCGTAITIMCGIVSADGKRFHVGCDCVRKTTDKGDKLRKAVDRAVRQRRKAAREAKELARIEAALALLSDEAVRAKLSAKPHPSAWHAGQGATLLNWCEWMRDNNVGHGGMFRMAKTVENAAK